MSKKNTPVKTRTVMLTTWGQCRREDCRKWRPINAKGLCLPCHMKAFAEPAP
jgi:hypothetical protein